MSQPDGPVLFFDGVCNLCNSSVQFVIRHDKKGVIRFATLQSEAGQKASAAVKKDRGDVPDSLIFYKDGRYYTLSDAALQVAGLLDGAWKATTAFFIIPRFIRNPIYRFVARNRYRWFGKKDECMLPTPALKSRFLN